MSTATSIFGPIVSGYDVEGWLLETLGRWSGTYLAEVERQHGLTAGDLPRVRSWRTAPSFDKWPEDQLPSVIVVSVGLAEPPLKDGEGRYRARWLMQIGCVCSANSQERSRELAMLYVTAHRELIDNRPSLEGRAHGVRWLDEDYTSVPYDDVRSLGAGTASFEVMVEGVGSGASAGPVTPDDPLSPETDPWPDWPTVQTHDEQVVKLPLDEGGT